MSLVEIRERCLWKDDVSMLSSTHFCKLEASKRWQIKLSAVALACSLASAHLHSPSLGFLDKKVVCSVTGLEG